MQYREIVAVTGLTGLYHLMATKSDGAIVRNLQDNSTKFVPARLHNVTPLESIEVYTMGDNVRLHEVFQKMKDSPAARPDAKASSADIKKYFAEVYPDMDADRVYDSDRKKMVKWFELLKTADLLDFSAVNKTEEAGGEVEDAASDAGTAEGEAQTAETAKGSDTAMPLVEEGEEIPTKKARAKKAAAPATEEGEEAAPKKKAAKKSAAPTEGSEEKPAKKATAKKKSEE